ncbi:hypothetical protein AZA_47496 [Nitrospirillum viridazoti Y2]|nr:hypothetical protein AZA_47496 [Nitrospirillum amazonense Y2]
MAADVHRIVQQKAAAAEHQVAEAVAEGAARQRTDHAARAATDGQGVGRQVPNVPRQGTGVDQLAQAAGGGDVNHRGARQAAAVGQGG